MYVMNVTMHVYAECFVWNEIKSKKKMENKIKFVVFY